MFKKEGVLFGYPIFINKHIRSRNLCFPMFTFVHMRPLIYVESNVKQILERNISNLAADFHIEM